MSSLKDRTVVQCIWKGIKAKKLVTLVAFSALVLGLVLLGLAGTPTSVADTDLPDDEVIGSLSETSDSPAGAAITITMYTESDE